MDGEIPLEQTTQTPTNFSENLADMHDKKTDLFGYVDTTGVWIIESKFKSTQRFTDGVAAVKSIDTKGCGYIDKKGQIVIPEKFKIALPFKNGLAQVQLNKQKAYINKLGEFIWLSKDF